MIHGGCYLCKKIEPGKVLVSTLVQGSSLALCDDCREECGPPPVVEPVPKKAGKVRA